jgi:hypothetical protein
MGPLVRGAVVVVGILVMLAGLASIGLPEIGLAGLSWVAIGAFLVVIVALERQRYRSATAERSNAPAGPGGGETADSAIEPVFRPTGEVFIDPTSGRRMRVLVDPVSGERRYVAEA